MTRNNRRALSSVVVLVLFSHVAVGATSSPEATTVAAAIVTRYNADKAACTLLIGSPADMCIEEALSRAEIANADLAYTVNWEKCDRFFGNQHDVCREEAKRTYFGVAANITLRQKTIDATAIALITTKEARKDADAAKRLADYGVAKTKCGALSLDDSLACVKAAKIRHNQI